MNYVDGQKIIAGDIVKLGDDNGVVVGIIENSKEADKDFMQQWGYLKKGFMAEFPKWGLIYYEEPENDLQLLERSEGKYKRVEPSRKKFSKGQRVIVSHVGGWKRNFLGTIASEPEDVQTMLGKDFYYWVKFDEPQEDVNGSDEYIKAQILSCYLSEYEEDK